MGGIIEQSKLVLVCLKFLKICNSHYKEKDWWMIFTQWAHWGCMVTSGKTAKPTGRGRFFGHALRSRHSLCLGFLLPGPWACLTSFQIQVTHPGRRLSRIIFSTASLRTSFSFFYAPKLECLVHLNTALVLQPGHSYSRLPTAPLLWNSLGRNHSWSRFLPLSLELSVNA